MNIEVKGIEEIEMNIEKIAQKMDPDVVEQILLRQADMLKDAIVSVAPQGETGNLKKGIVSKVLARRGLIEKKYAPAMVGINYRIAPHAHLVEFGHQIRQRRKGTPGSKALYSKITMSTYVQPHPFFRPVWDLMKDSVRDNIEQEIKSNIEGAPS
jgi:HK97 gp10 family phage protein